MSPWLDTPRGRNARDRCSANPAPDTLPLLDPDHDSLLRRWVGQDAVRRARGALLKEAGGAGIERAEMLCERLLESGWIIRHDKLMGGAWQWEAITWRDLPALQGLLGVSSPRQRGEARQAQMDAAKAWLESRSDGAATETLDPDLLDELAHALKQLAEEKALRLDLLNARLELLRSVAEWHDREQQGTRRDFALFARDGTKALTEAEWRWLETAFDLERLRINRFEPVMWLAGDLDLTWPDARKVQLSSLRFAGLPMMDLMQAIAASSPRHWWLIENRASFERQALQRKHPDAVLIWMPGRPSSAWLETVSHLLALAPAPGRISADADPSGIAIASAVGKIWDRHGMAWEPYQMGMAQLKNSPQHWPLNEHDRRLLDALDETSLPEPLMALCREMQRSGRKAEQEAWL